MWLNFRNVTTGAQCTITLAEDPNGVLGLSQVGSVLSPQALVSQVPLHERFSDESMKLDRWSDSKARPLEPRARSEMDYKRVQLCTGGTIEPPRWSRLLPALALSVLLGKAPCRPLD